MSTYRTDSGLEPRASSLEPLAHSPKLMARGSKLAALMLTLSLSHVPFAQDIHLSQFFNAPLVLNPANAGDIEGDQRAALMYRTQWQSAGSPFRTQAFSYDLPLFRQRMKGRYLGVGIHLFSDKAGNTKFGDTQGNLSVSYAIKSGDESLLAFGIQGGYGQRSAVLNGMRWDSQYNGAGYNPDLPTGETMADASTNFVDFGAGVLWKGETKSGAQWKSGASVYHLNQPMVSLFGSNDDRLLRRYVLHAEMRFEGKKWTWLPKVYVQQQGGGREAVLGALMHRRINVDSRYTTHKNSSAIYMGCFYRWNDAVVPTLQFEWQRKLVAALSYDVNVSRLRAQTSKRGGMEVSIQWIGVFDDKRMKLSKSKVY
jgi:type IX secretion system PorP/SprF family membrane protein